MEASGLRTWFDGYLQVFAACGRGAEDDLRALLEFYAVPLLLTSDAGALALASENEVLGAVRQQVDGMRAAGYDRSVMLEPLEVTPLNAASALLTGTFSRRRGDGGEIGRLRGTYFVTDGAAGPRISALAVHAA